MADFNNSGPRGNGGGGSNVPAGVLILAIAAIPLIYKAIKPALKRIEDEFSKFANRTPSEAAESAATVATPEAPPTPAEPAPSAASTAAKPAAQKGTTTKPKPTKKAMDTKTTKTGKKAAGVPITTASPTGHEEMGEAHSAEAAGTSTPPATEKPTKSASQKKPVGDQPQNPKKTRPSKQ